MARIAAIATLIVTGVIIADVLTHPGGVAAASSGINQIAGTSFNALLGGGHTGGRSNS